MTLKKLLQILAYINRAYASVEDISMHGSHIWCNGGGELSITFNTQPPRSLHDYLKRRGFIEYRGEYIYRPR